MSGIYSKLIYLIYNILVQYKKILIQLILMPSLKLKTTIIMFIVNSFQEEILTFVISLL